MIMDYLYSNYSVTTSEYSMDWMIMDKFSGGILSKDKFLIVMNKMFFRMNSNNIINDWFNNGITIMEDKVNNHLKRYKLSNGNKPLVWVINNSNGKEFYNEVVIKELMTLLPNHIHEKKIRVIFNRWLTNAKVKATEKLIGC